MKGMTTEKGSDQCSHFFTLYFSCATENCNTMDPRNSGESAAHTLGFTLGLNAILFAIARLI